LDLPALWTPVNPFVHFSDKQGQSEEITAMNSKPRNLSEALEQLENIAGATGADLKSKLQRELHDLEEKIRELKPQLDDLKDKVHDEAIKAKDKVETQVKENPWAAIGIVGLIFFVLGFLFAGRGRSD
jgi:ElaB/YqjD/DUF883 family membrane-anchored ribosome-binding protein